MSDSWSGLKLLIGTYSRGTESDGIYLVQGEQTRLIAESDNPSYLVQDPTKNIVYCVNESGDFQDEHGASSETGAISAFQFTRLESGEIYLDLINQQPSMGADPCHLSIDRDGQFLVVSNYTGGTFASFSLEGTGYIEPFQSLTSHTGKGPDPNRQDSAHVHSSLLAANQLFIADLGSDRVSCYNIDAAGAVGTARHHIVSEPGAGPRFLALHKGTLFVLNELDNTLTSYDANTFKRIQSLSIVPDSETTNLAAHLALSEDGRYLYLTNRGFDTISVFKTTPELSHIQTIAAGGEHPRHFALVNSERNLVVANQYSDNLVLFNRDIETGLLEDTGRRLDVPAPACVLEV